ncbi:uncharacterized protein LOC128869954 [Anastrepha ludens]|uniref:uncharacterized protein LOC128869954 n=1 Tax=Anastrepha ludens TaxID=28586 RepID=UPI0023AEBB36|nr:uncharacterized protein LOC128869954 [Anastrepha ludens]
MDKETTGQSCRKCDAADNESMVQCDTCDAWYHFNCVGVHSNVADESWSCESCQNHASTTNAHPTASSSPTTKQGNRHVNFLPTFPTIAKISNSTVNPLLKPAWASSNWNFEPSTSVQGSQLPNKSSEYNPGLQQFTTGSIATSANEISYSQPKVFSSVQQVGIRNGQGMQMPFNSEIYRNLQLEKLEEQMKLQQKYLDNKYKILSQYNDLPSSSTSMASFSNGPTPGQLAARQAIPKQLPTFNGDPEEWPLFISSFDNSTTVAGYTDAENLIRLQASLKGKAREMVKYEGSSVTLMEKRIFDELGLKGEQDPLCLRWTGNTTRVEENSVRAAIEISSVTNWQKYTLKNIHTVDDLNLPAQSINASAMERLYPYLAGLPIASYNNVKPSLLIGADNWRLAIPLKIREGTWFQPIASKPRLGWALQGCNSRQTAEYRLNVHTCDCQKRYDELHETVKEFFTLESSKPTQLLPEEDAKAVSIANNTCKKGDNFYEIGPPWRISSVLLPNNYVYALQRLMWVREKTLLIEAAISNGKTWYLPIFIVSNPNKPGKLRMVWDAAAKVNGVSLNDFLLSGPDLLNPLVSILLAFRVGRVAICGDIAEMFHRINIRDSDMHAQRFLWCDDGDDPQQPSVYVMRALTFGLNCAPFIAHYIRDKNADHFENELPRAVEAVKKNHYVDDFIDCGDDEQSALELAQQIKKIHGAAGFNIRGWSSNSKFVVEQLEEDPMSVQSVKEWGSTTKVLGMFWDPLSDNFKYICRFARLRRDVINESIIPTKREALQVLMSIFDPLGFVCCYTVGLKILLQDVWRSGLAWDDPLQDNLFDKWNQWKSIMPLITAGEIPRCYSLLLKDAEDVQLHTFVDAGESAYAAVCYLRVSKGNDVTVSLVAGKSKVAPLKPLSIPRLELQAAVIGVRLANMVSNTQRINIMSKYWWTDSKTVLRWMRMDPKNFHQFVMHRIGEILEASNVSQWRWVPSRNNPADLATKTTTRQCYQLWFTGPNFLRSSAEVWPQCEELSLEECDDSEIKHYVLHMKKEHMNNLMLNVEHFSSWKRLYRAVATFLFYVDRLRSVVLARQRKTSIDFDMIQKAQCLLIRYAQSIEYCEEIRCLKRGKNIDNSSKLFTLNVYLDTDGIIRCKSRVEHLNNHEDIIVMPNSHHVTFLIVRWAHENFHHLMHESVINQIRGTYFINRLRVLYKRVRAECQKCKNHSSIPQPPQMAALPAARIAAFERPFTYVGIDYFGPLLVIVGRRREKRWGVLFTCLTLRAIHIEVAHSLNTSSCIMAIRNFISRRGYPREIFSDNGTNFKASEKIISESLKNIDLNGIASSFDRVKWRFNPPSAPHMGGAWERLVRSVKTVLYEILPSTSFSDESLRSALNEVEFILNARPLTFVSLENSDDEALTPNHLLIGSSDGYKPICSDIVNLRQRWQLTQQFDDRFWHRWVKEYIPVISRRTKWFTKQRPVRIGDVVRLKSLNIRILSVGGMITST